MAPAPRPPDTGPDPAPQAPRVVVADDHGLTRQGMRLLLNSVCPGCEVVEADTLPAAMAALGAATTDMLLLDLDMPGMNGILSVETLRTIFPELKIAVVSGSADQQTIVHCLSAGANGYVLKEEAVNEVARAIAAVLEGYSYVSRGAAPVLETDTVVSADRPGRFTARQHDVLRQLKLGRSNKEIARELRLSEGTVKIHLAAIYRLLRARNRTEAVVLAGQLKS